MNKFNGAKNVMKYFIAISILFWIHLIQGQTTTTKVACVSQLDSILGKTIYLKVDSMPEFPGGIDSLHTFLRQNILWPNNIDFSGTVLTVLISVIVESDGSLTNEQVVRGIDTSVDQVALNVIA